MLTTGVKFGGSGTPFGVTCDAGVDALTPGTNIFLGFGLKYTTLQKINGNL